MREADYERAHGVRNGVHEAMIAAEKAFPNSKADEKFTKED